MKHGTYWGNPGYSFMLFKEDNTIGNDWVNVLANYNTNQWYNVKIHYERSGDQVTLTYWKNGSYIGQVTETVDLSAHITMDHFRLSVQEGSAYFDDIRVYVQ